MASPFKIFRKHQKVMLAVTGVLAMISFVFLAPLMGVLGGGGPGGGAGETVVESRYGDLTEGDLGRMVQKRRILNDFLMNAAQQGQMAVISSGDYEAMYRMQLALQQIGRRNPTERDVVRSMLLAARAEELGFVVSDAEVNRFLRDVTADAVPAARLRDLLRNTRLDGQQVSMETIFSVIRTELLASQLESTYDLGNATTPAERWNYYEKLKNQVTVGLLPVTVASFVSEVADPTDAELQEFYDKYKDRYAEPDFIDGVRMNSPTPGFREHLRFQWQFLRADRDLFVEMAAREVTDREIAQYYEDNKRDFTELRLLGESEDDTPGPPEPPAGADREPEAEGEDAAAGEAAAQEEPAKEEAGKEEPAKEEAAGEEPAQGPAAGDGSALPTTRRRLGLQYVALLQEEGGGDAGRPPEPAGDDAKEAGSTDESAPGDGAPQDAAPETSAPEDSAPKAGAPETSAPEAGAPENGAPEDSAAEESAPEDSAPEESAAIGDGAAGPPPPKYLPLEKVADQIRGELARQRAPALMESALEPALAKMRRFWRARAGWEAEQPLEGPQTSPPPEPPNLEELARENQLAMLETAPISYYQLSELPLGKAIMDGSGQPLALYAFSGELVDYRPLQATDDDGNRYLAWKIQQLDARTPPLDEIRDYVVQVWKRVKAREQASAEAERLASLARERGVPLAEVFEDQPQFKVTVSEPFSWLSTGPAPAAGGSPQISLGEVTGVDGADNAFMETVFGLGPGEVGVATNHAQSVAYVVRLASHERPVEALREDFLREQRGPWNQLALRSSQMEILTALQAELEQDARLVWHRAPDAPQMR